jgi:hypothetical protein
MITGDSVVMVEPEAEACIIPADASRLSSGGSRRYRDGDRPLRWGGRYPTDRKGRQRLRRVPAHFYRLILPGDSLFAVATRETRIIVFETAAGHYVGRSSSLASFPASNGDGMVDTADSVWSWGSVPEIYTQSMSAYSQGGEPSIVRRGEGWLAVYPADGRVFELSADGKIVRAIDIPHAHRRGIPPGLADSVRAIQASGVFRYAASMVFAIWELPSGSYAIIHMDTDPIVNPASAAAASGTGGITYEDTRYWVTFLSNDLSRACPDAHIPFEPDNLLVPFVKADSVFFLSRTVATDTAANAVLHRFRVDDRQCDWVKTVDASTPR